MLLIFWCISFVYANTIQNDTYILSNPITTQIVVTRLIVYCKSIDFASVLVFANNKNFIVIGNQKIHTNVKISNIDPKITIWTVLTVSKEIILDLMSLLKNNSNIEDVEEEIVFMQL